MILHKKRLFFCTIAHLECQGEYFEGREVKEKVRVFFFQIWFCYQERDRERENKET